jgi:hypothetical protein
LKQRNGTTGICIQILGRKVGQNYGGLLQHFGRFSAAILVTLLPSVSGNSNRGSDSGENFERNDFGVRSVIRLGQILPIIINKYQHYILF